MRTIPAVLMLAACGTAAPIVTEVPVAAQPVATAAAATVFADARGEPLCPVMGQVTPMEKATSSTVYEGVTYYFCCDSCAEQFAKAPAEYANGKFLVAEGLMADPASCGHE